MVDFSPPPCKWTISSTNSGTISGFACHSVPHAWHDTWNIVSTQSLPVEWVSEISHFLYSPGKLGMPLWLWIALLPCPLCPLTGPPFPCRCFLLPPFQGLAPTLPRHLKKFIQGQDWYWGPIAVSYPATYNLLKEEGSLKPGRDP